jgi:hypothetical protein
MTFAFRIQNLDVKWEIRNGSIFIREIVKL